MTSPSQQLKQKWIAEDRRAIEGGYEGGELNDLIAEVGGDWRTICRIPSREIDYKNPEQRRLVTEWYLLWKYYEDGSKPPCILIVIDDGQIHEVSCDRPGAIVVQIEVGIPMMSTNAGDLDNVWVWPDPAKYLQTSMIVQYVEEKILEREQIIDPRDKNRYGGIERDREAIEGAVGITGWRS